MPWIMQQAVLVATGLLVLVVGTVWAVVLSINAVLGLSTMPDDYSATATNLEIFFHWLIKQDPSKASFVMAALVMVLGLFVLGYFWSRNAQHAAQQGSPSAKEGPPEALIAAPLGLGGRPMGLPDGGPPIPDLP